MEKRIVIIGAGPAGLGAAYRLKETGYSNFAFYEEKDYVGGLSASYLDEKGFTWDIGGHVLFSHYPYFDKAVEKALHGDRLLHERRSFIRICNRFVPYPFQNNIRYLPNDLIYRCLIGLMEANGAAGVKEEPANFMDWISATFGKGITELFMEPYNRKVWAYPLEKMDKNWIAERVSVTDFRRVLKNVVLAEDDVNWGPNNRFIFPLFGGTGQIFSAIHRCIGSPVRFGHKLEAVDIDKREVRFSNGVRDTYDTLITTVPLTSLIGYITPEPKQDIFSVLGLLQWNSGYIVGLGLRGIVPDNKCWMYFPEDNTPFYRVTYFSNYSPNNVPTHTPHYSLMCETSYSAFNRHNKDLIIDETIKGLINTGLIQEKDKKDIVSTYLIDIDRSYPIPTLKRDKALDVLQHFLKGHNIFSRGRFGGFRYEVGNMDHSFIQGVEAVNNILTGEAETVYRLRTDN